MLDGFVGCLRLGKPRARALVDILERLARGVVIARDIHLGPRVLYV